MPPTDSRDPRLPQLIEKWAAQTRTAAKKDGYESLSRILDIQLSPTQFKKLMPRVLERQIALVKYVASGVLLNSQSLEQTEKFVSLQSYDRLHSKKDPWYTVYFHLLNGAKVFLLVRDLKNVPFADIYSVTIFHAIYVTHPEPNWITPKVLDYFVKCLKNDLKSDGFKLKYDLWEHYGPIKKNLVLSAECDIDGMPGIDNYVHINHAQELFKMKIMDWFRPNSRLP